MKELSRIEGLVNQKLLLELGDKIIGISEDLWEEGFDSEEIIEYLNKVIGEKIVNTIYNLEQSQSI